MKRYKKQSTKPSTPPRRLLATNRHDHPATTAGQPVNLSRLTHGQIRSLYTVMTALFTDLRSDWESRPENKEKTFKYTEVWEQFCKERGFPVRPRSATGCRPKSSELSPES